MLINQIMSVSKYLYLYLYL